MKALNLFSLTLFFLIIFGSTYGQTTKSTITIDEPFYIYCDENDDVPTDLLTGSWTFSLLQHSSKKNGKYWERIASTNTEYVSEWTGEVFKEVFVYQYYESKSSSNKIIIHRNWRLLGNMGTHYMCSLTAEMDPETGELLFLQHSHKCL